MSIPMDSQCIQCYLRRNLELVRPLGDTAVSDMNTLNAVLSACEIGDAIRATVYRSGKQGTVYLTVEEAKN